MTWWLLPFKAVAVATTILVKAMPVFTSSGRSPMALTAWSIRGLSLINCNVLSGRSRDLLMFLSLAWLSMHFSEEQRESYWALVISIIEQVLNRIIEQKTHCSRSGVRYFARVHHPLHKWRRDGNRSLKLAIWEHSLDVFNFVCTYCRVFRGVSVNQKQDISYNHWEEAEVWNYSSWSFLRFVLWVLFEAVSIEMCLKKSKSSNLQL